MAILSTILNILRTVGKPVANAINGVIQSLDADGNGRLHAINAMRQQDGRPLLTTNAMRGNLRDVVTVLGDATPDESDAASAAVAAQHARDLNIMLHEIPFFEMDEYAIELRQSVAVAIPSNASLIASVCLSPVMNLGGILSNLARQFAVMRVNGVFLEVAQQNQIYSTVELAYDPTVSRADIDDMTTDLEGFYADGKEAFGTRITYYTASAGQVPGQVEINGAAYEQGSFSTYTTRLNRIKRTVTAARAATLPDSTLGIAQPGFRLCPMSSVMPSSPVYFSGMQYIGLEYARDFIGAQGEHMEMNDADSQMPVYGKFYYAMSNTYAQPVDQILTVRYNITCKYRRDGATYQNPDETAFL